MVNLTRCRLRLHDLKVAVLSEYWRASPNPHRGHHLEEHKFLECATPGSSGHRDQAPRTPPWGSLHLSKQDLIIRGYSLYGYRTKKKQKQIFIYSTWMHFKIKSSAKPMQGPVEWIQLNIFHLGQIKTPSELSFNNQISAKTTEYWWFEKSHEEQKLASGRQTYHMQEMAHYSWQNNQQTEESLIEIHEPRFTDDLVPISPWHGSYN